VIRPEASTAPKDIATTVKISSVVFLPIRGANDGGGGGGGGGGGKNSPFFWSLIHFSYRLVEELGDVLQLSQNPDRLSFFPAIFIKSLLIPLCCFDTPLFKIGDPNIVALHLFGDP
jgi:hypothetical protein